MSVVRPGCQTSWHRQLVWDWLCGRQLRDRRVNEVSRILGLSVVGDTNFHRALQLMSMQNEQTECTDGTHLVP